MDLVRRVRVLCCCLLAVPVVSVAQEKNDIPGVYAVEGTNPKGQQYTGIVQIVAKDDTFVFHWVLENEESYGLGIISKGMLVVAAGPSTSSGLLLASVVAYVLKQGEPMVGEWATPATPGIYKEILTKLPVGAVPLERLQRQPVKPDEKPVKASRAPADFPRL